MENENRNHTHQDRMPSPIVVDRKSDMPAQVSKRKSDNAPKPQDDKR